jgi:hypothetical protein
VCLRSGFAELDRLNIISIDVRSLSSAPSSRPSVPQHSMRSTQVHHNVRPDSLLVLHAARQVCEEPGFDDVLDGVRARVDEIESLHRTRELTVRSVRPVAVAVDEVQC